MTASHPPLLLIWLRELRIPFFVGTVTPAVFGAAYAHYLGASFIWPLLLLTVLGTALTNAGLNMANDYFDHLSGDDYLTPDTPVSGGSKIIQQGLLRPRQVLRAAIGCLIAASAIGLYLNALTGGWVILATGIIGMVFAWFYAAPPLKLGHRSGIGELVCLLGCGPVIAFGAFFVQAGHFSWPALVASLPIGLLMALVLFVNEFHDHAADAAVGKRTLVVVLGTRRAAILLAVMLGVTFILTVLLVAARILPPFALVTLGTLPLAAFAALRALRFHDNSPRLLPANFVVIGLHLLFGIVLTTTASL